MRVFHFLGFIMLFMGVLGCKSPRQRLADFRAKYPCPQTGRIDTVTTVRIDSFPVYVEGKTIIVKTDCPASPEPTVKYVTVTTKGDTIYAKAETKTVVRKEYYEDMARIDSMKAEVEKANNTNDGILFQKNVTINGIEKSKSNWRTAALISWVLILLIGLGLGLLIKKVKLF